MKLTERVRVQAHNSRARCLGTSSTLTLVEWEQTIADFNGMCAYCNMRLFTVLEHFIPFGHEGDGTHVNNCLPSCRMCNNLKKDRPLEVFTQRLGKETVERLQTYLASRTPIADGPPSIIRRLSRPEPRTAEEIRKIKLIGGIGGRKPQRGDEIELQGEHGIVRRKVDWVPKIYVNGWRPHDYDVQLLPLSE